MLTCIIMIILCIRSTNPDPKVRHSIWTQCFYQVFAYLPLMASNQMIVQRYHAVSSTFKAQL